jgi:hypothetical protein
MAFLVNFARGPRFTLAEVTGLAFVEDAKPLLKKIEAETRMFGDDRLLINLLDVVGTLGPAEHEFLGQLVVKHLSHLNKVASLVPEDKITRISEGVARSQGLELRVFVSLGEAVDWLLAD